jgi:acyl carrier protein
MNGIDERLQQCFLAVFPALSRDAIPAASIENVAEWDSVSNINLLTVIEEEFGISISTGDLVKLKSFPLIRQYLAARLAGGA